MAVVNVPAAYQQWVSQAAEGTGLPYSVVAAQINEESGFNPNATSPTGAEGIAQFEPGTYASSGGTGSEYVAQNELQPYINLTKQDLSWSGGNVEKALAAYNAGEGNWQAGIGYAETILSAAGQSQSLMSGTPGDVDVSGNGSNTTPAQTTSFSLNPLSWLQGLLGGTSSASDYLERGGLIIFGGILILVGFWLLAGKQTVKIGVKAAEAGAVA